MQACDATKSALLSLTVQWLTKGQLLIVCELLFIVPRPKVLLLWQLEEIRTAQICVTPYLIESMTKTVSK